MKTISEEFIGPLLLASIHETLETMVGFTDVETISPVELATLDIDQHVPSIVAFVGVASGFAGACSLHASLALAQSLAAGLLCVDDPSEVSEAEVKDAYAELTNMICGGLKNRMEAEGHHFALSIPVVMTMPVRVAPHYPEGVGVTMATVRTQDSNSKCKSACSL